MTQGGRETGSYAPCIFNKNGDTTDQVAQDSTAGESRRCAEPARVRGGMKTRRAALTVVFALSFLAAPLAIEAQPARRVYRIAFLGSGSSTDGYSEAFREAFREGLRELGWVEGQNLVIDYHFANGKLDRLPALAAELVRLKVDVIVAAPTPAVVAARNATHTIPIVMINVGDPVGLGLAASLARPGGNVTGSSFAVGVEVFGKELELLRETVPKARHVAVLSNPVNPAHTLAISNVSLAARSLGVQLLLLRPEIPTSSIAHSGK
jgi:putative tryptophan/tyrosine transport system substrate-binding protein